jgi:hypothetical protein
MECRNRFIYYVTIDLFPTLHLMTTVQLIYFPPYNLQLPIIAPPPACDKTAYALPYASIMLGPPFQDVPTDRQPSFWRVEDIPIHHLWALL